MATNGTGPQHVPQIVILEPETSVLWTYPETGRQSTFISLPVRHIRIDWEQFRPLANGIAKGSTSQGASVIGVTCPERLREKLLLVFNGPVHGPVESVSATSPSCRVKVTAHAILLEYQRKATKVHHEYTFYSDCWATTHPSPHGTPVKL